MREEGGVIQESKSVCVGFVIIVIILLMKQLMFIEYFGVFFF